MFTNIVFATVHYSAVFGNLQKALDTLIDLCDKKQWHDVIRNGEPLLEIYKSDVQAKTQICGYIARSYAKLGNFAEAEKYYCLCISNVGHLKEEDDRFLFFVAMTTDYRNFAFDPKLSEEQKERCRNQASMALSEFVRIFQDSQREWKKELEGLVNYAQAVTHIALGFEGLSVDELSAKLERAKEFYWQKMASSQESRIFCLSSIWHAYTLICRHMLKEAEDEITEISSYYMDSQSGAMFDYVNACLLFKNRSCLKCLNEIQAKFTTYQNDPAQEHWVLFRWRSLLDEMTRA